jgi:hypothetical protein
MSNFNPAGAGWSPDPSGRHQLRYWDGATWTDHVSDGGVAGTDPIGAPPAPGGFPGQPPAFAPVPGDGQPPPVGQQLGYGYAPVGTGERPKPIKGLATALSVLLAITAVAALLLALAFFNRASILDDPFGASFDELQSSDDAVAGGGGFLILGLLVTGIVWLIWQYRHAKNARALGQTDGLGPGWAIGGWFIPLGNWVIPQLQLKQAAEASDPSGARKAPPIVIVWWVLWVVGAVAGFGSGNRGEEEISSIDDIDSFQSADQIAGASLFVFLAAAIAAIVMVRTLSRRQHEAAAARGMPL